MSPGEAVMLMAGNDEVIMAVLAGGVWARGCPRVLATILGDLVSGRPPGPPERAVGVGARQREQAAHGPEWL